jgi:hypothetical protein
VRITGVVTVPYYCCAGANIEVHIQVLTTGYWPSPAACNTLIIPEEVRLVTVSLLYNSYPAGRLLLLVCVLSAANATTVWQGQSI